MTGSSDLTARLLAGDTLALARAISIVEDRLPEAREILEKAFPHSGKAPIIGVTGPPGAGKSTLVDALTGVLRARRQRVGIIAVDPSSTFSGGAVLGDRVRMQRHSTDGGVFIRSMATRGHFGGLARATIDAADLMDAAGCETVIIETVGVGQDEVDVVRVADVVLVVLVPGMGDDIQTIKAGIMEIPDIFVLNKADRDGIDRLQTDVRSMLTMFDGSSRPPADVVRTIAAREEGVEELYTVILERLEKSDPAVTKARKSERSRERLLDLLRERVLEWADGPSTGATFDRIVEQVTNRTLDPHSAADLLLEHFTPGGNGP